MKKKATLLSLALSAVLLCSTAAYGAEIKSIGDIPLGGSGQMEMIGTIDPTILTVTMPTIVPFNISNSIIKPNKVVSPRISVKNNSNVPVQVDVAYTRVDLSKMTNTTWSDTGAVNDNQIAIGLKPEEVKDEMPTDLSNTKWLKANKAQDINVLNLKAKQEDAMYVVGTLGPKVSESTTFSVTPTFVVSMASGTKN